MSRPTIQNDNIEHKFEPTAIVASLSLAGLAAGFAELTTSLLISSVGGIIFLLAGASTVQLFWYMILPSLLDYFIKNKINFRKKHQWVLIKVTGIFIRLNFRFLTLSLTLDEIRLVGYLNSLIAFLLFYVLVIVGIVVKIIDVLSNNGPIFG